MKKEGAGDEGGQVAGERRVLGQEGGTHQTTVNGKKVTLKEKLRSSLPKVGVRGLLLFVGGGQKKKWGG